jgi:FkbM family methyltransferase
VPVSPDAPSLLRRIAREARLAFRRGPAGRLIERRRHLNAARSWTEADESMRSFYSQFVGAGSLVFDVGANVGNRTKVFLRLGARVVAVEPQPECARLLAEAFRGDSRLTIECEALGRAPGAAELKLSDASTISSMSAGWIDAVRSSGRFAQYHWDHTVPVRVTTLDDLIERHGVPAFVKIDVEGFEYEVLAGLSAPLPALSFEFTPEWSEAAFACLAHLERLGIRRFNYSLGESMRLESENWLDAGELRARILEMRGDARTFGDVYARHEAAPSASAGAPA